MKKKIILIILLFSMMIIPVYAEERRTGELIPKNETSTVDTETFKYQGLTYVEGEPNSMIKINSVFNKTAKQMPMSINVLLFDSNRMNIGFVSYCTEKDVESNYSQVKVSSNQAKELTIKVTKKYFVEEKTSKDVAFYSVLDANQYCQIGGYDKYKGLTIEEIVNGTGDVTENHTFIGKIMDPILPYIPIVVGVIVFVIVVSIIAKIIKKVSSEKMVNNKIQSLPKEDKKKEEIVEEKEPERIRKEEAKEEELIEEEKPVENTHKFVNTGFNETPEETVSNETTLLTETYNEAPKEDLAPPKESESFSLPEENSTTPNNSNDNNELMDLFK